jgi:C4-dicarboxylate-specific signal transduction histidine kinase
MPKNVTLETAWPTPGPVISADAGRIQQLLTNLVTNGWEAIGLSFR